MLESLLPCLHLICKTCLPNAQDWSISEEQVCPICSGTDPELENEQSEQAPEDAMDIDFSYNPSSKVQALLQNLRTDKSQSGGDLIKR